MLPLFADLSFCAVCRFGGRKADPFAMTPEERAIFEKRRRGRNIALLLLLVGLSVLFYFIGIARLLRS
jgi:hypothetical protein